MYDWFGENIITPIVFYTLIFVFAIKTHKTERTLFDERWNRWDERKKE